MGLEWRMALSDALVGPYTSFARDTWHPERETIVRCAEVRVIGDEGDIEVRLGQAITFFSYINVL
jgi:hypothetical protein